MSDFSVNVLLTGSAGFIATNLSLYLEPYDINMIGVDSLVSGSQNVSVTNHLVKHFIADIADSVTVNEIFDSYRIDVVVHLAALGNVVESVQNPIQNFDSNLKATLMLLEVMRAHNVDRIVFASTGGALMGHPLSLPVNEMSVPNPISPYGASKLACEAYLSAYAESYNMNAIALRFGNVIGPYSGHKKGVVNKWVKLLANDDDVIIYGNGSATRDYISVFDICQGIKLAIDAFYKGKNFNHFEVFHLANNQQVSLSDLFVQLKKSTKSQSNVIYLPSRIGEVENICADFTKASDLLGFSPKYSLEETLMSYLDWIDF